MRKIKTEMLFQSSEKRVIISTDPFLILGAAAIFDGRQSSAAITFMTEI